MSYLNTTYLSNSHALFITPKETIGFIVYILCAKNTFSLDHKFFCVLKKGNLSLFSIVFLIFMKSDKKLL